LKNLSLRAAQAYGGAQRGSSVVVEAQRDLCLASATRTAAAREALRLVGRDRFIGPLLGAIGTAEADDPHAFRSIDYA